MPTYAEICAAVAVENVLAQILHYVCYMGKGEFQMYLSKMTHLEFAHHWTGAIAFSSREKAEQAIETFRGRYRDADLKLLFVAQAGTAEAKSGAV